MFTGIVEEVGHVVVLSRTTAGAQLVLAAERVSQGLKPAESVAVAGVCLTVSEVQAGRIQCDLSPETLSRTTLGNRKAGDAVNLERSLRLGDPVSGHLVTGHVDCLGVVTGIQRASGGVEMRFTLPPEWMRYVVEKGSVAVDGVSLTSFAVSERGFRVALIPETLARTTLSRLRPEDRVNIETDIVGKYVERFVPDRPVGSAGECITQELLGRAGFMD